MKIYRRAAKDAKSRQGDLDYREKSFMALRSYAFIAAKNSSHS
jgi:hypothetical protein